MGAQTSSEMFPSCTFRGDSKAYDPAACCRDSGLSCLDECRSGRPSWERQYWPEDRKESRTAVQTGQIFVGHVGQGPVSADPSDSTRIKPVVSLTHAHKQRAQELALAKIYAQFDEGKITEEVLEQEIRHIKSGKLLTDKPSSPRRRGKSPERGSDNSGRESPRRTAGNVKSSVDVHGKHFRIKYCYPGDEIHHGRQGLAHNEAPKSAFHSRIIHSGDRAASHNAFVRLGYGEVLVSDVNEAHKRRSVAEMTKW